MKKTGTKLLSLLLAFLLAFTTLVAAVPALTAMAADVNLSGDDYYLKLMYPDILSFQGSEKLQWSYAPNLDAYQNLLNVFLARGEREGCQVYFYEKGEGRDLRLEVAPYVNDNGDVLPHEIFNEHFFTITNVWDKPAAEALVPYGGETVHVDPETCATFYVELRAARNQTPGDYHSTYTLYNGDDVIRTIDVTATVWNFAIPETHYSTMIGGLYNSNSGYGSTRGFLEMSGIRFNSNKEIVEEDKAEAERILEGWHEFLLDHGVTPYELPRFLLANDPKTAALAAADPRRKAVAVPLYHSGSTITAAGKTSIANYQSLVGDSSYLADKMFFYPDDEPGWASDAEAATTTALVGNIKALWPDAHVVIPINQIGKYDYQGPKLKELTDIFCPNQVMLNGYQNVFDDFTDGSWHRTWRYLCNDHTGCIASLRWGKLPMGVYLRAPYWQAEVLGSNGLLNWNIGYVPYQDGKPYDIWGTQSIYTKMNGAGINGEAIIVFESKSLGLDPATPIASTRLKHINDAQDDYDYLELAKEAFGTGADSPYTKALNKVFQYYTSKGSKYIFSSETSAWPDGGNYEFVGHYGMDFVNARLILGNALSEAWTTDEEMHAFGDWATVVEPDSTHNGLQIRTCATCGAEESRKLDPATDCTHSFESYTPVDSGSHSAICTLCGETVTFPHTPGAAVRENAVTATCTTAGSYDEVIRCKDCGYEISRTTKTTPKAAHQWNAGTVTTQPTCTAAGVKTYSCANCTATKTEPVAALGHSWGGWTTTKQPTCTAEGQQTRTCTRDGSHKETRPIAKTAHTDDGSGHCRDCGTDLNAGNRCKYCGQIHTGTFGWLIKFFHSILALFGLRK